jgi:hypothetical protein
VVGKFRKCYYANGVVRVCRDGIYGYTSNFHIHVFVCEALVELGLIILEKNRVIWTSLRRVVLGKLALSMCWMNLDSWFF